MNVSAQTRGNEILEQLEGLITDSPYFLDANDFSTRQLKKQIDDITKTVPREGWLLNCIYQSFVGDVEKTIYAKNNAIRLGASSIDGFYNNIALAFMGLGCVSQTHELLADNLHPSKGHLTSCVAPALKSGMFTKLSEIREYILGKNMQNSFQEIMCSLEMASTFKTILSRHGLMDNSCAKLLDIAGDVAREKRLKIKEMFVVDYYRNDDEEAHGVSFFVGIKASNKDCFNLNMEFQKKLSEFVEAQDDVINIAFISATD